MEYDKFYAKLFMVGDSVALIVPSNLIKFTGLECGNSVEVMIKKKVE